MGRPLASCDYLLLFGSQRKLALPFGSQKKTAEASFDDWKRASSSLIATLGSKTCEEPRQLGTEKLNSMVEKPTEELSTCVCSISDRCGLHVQP